MSLCPVSSSTTRIVGVEPSPLAAGCPEAAPAAAAASAPPVCVAEGIGFDVLAAGTQIGGTTAAESLTPVEETTDDLQVKKTISSVSPGDATLISDHLAHGLAWSGVQGLVFTVGGDIVDHVGQSRVQGLGFRFLDFGVYVFWFRQQA